MNEYPYPDTEILEALLELKSQIQEIRKALTVTDDEKALEQGNNDPEEYKVELTPQEMSALLFSPPKDIPVKNELKPAPGHDEITALTQEIRILREQVEKEIKDVKNSVSVLSEMWGKHELEIREFKNRRYNK